MLIPGIVASSAVSGGGLPYAANIISWLDASVTSSITSDANGVTLWEDQSGNGNDASTYSHSGGTVVYDGPKSGTHTINGLNVLHFTQANTECLDWVDGFLLTPVTIFTVYQIDNNNSGIWGASVISQYAPEDDDIYFYHANALHKSWFNVRDAEGNHYAQNNIGSYGTPILSTCAADTVSPLENRLNGAVATLVSPNTAISSSAGGAPLHTYIGMRYNNGLPQQTLGGLIAEIVVYDFRMSASQMSEVETYLNLKWSVY